jgi:hypothetical protein
MTIRSAEDCEGGEWDTGNEECQQGPAARAVHDGRP